LPQFPGQTENAKMAHCGRIFPRQKSSMIMTSMLLFLGNLGTTELVLIFLVVLLLFGGNKIPELMRGLGKGIREFNNAKNSVEDEIRQGMREAEKKPLEK